MTLVFIVVYFLRKAIMVATGVAAVACLLDWVVRTRKIHPFHPVARTVRRVIDPMIAPVERTILRAGGSPASVPIWALVGCVVVGAVAISALDFVVQTIVTLMMGIAAGPSGVLAILIHLTFGLLQLAIFIVIIVSWLPISPYSPWVRWAFAISDPILRPLRAIVPRFGAIDVTPIVAFFLLRLVEGFVMSLIPMGGAGGPF